MKLSTKVGSNTLFIVGPFDEVTIFPTPAVDPAIIFSTSFKVTASVSPKLTIPTLELILIFPTIEGK
jgi:hypothetical protein